MTFFLVNSNISFLLVLHLCTFPVFNAHFWPWLVAAKTPSALPSGWLLLPRIAVGA